MSWQGWIDSMFVPDDEGKVWVAEAAICGYEDGQETVWASSDGYKNITAAEIKRILKGGNDLHQSGPYVCGEKCQLIRNLLDAEEHCMDLKTRIGADGQSYCVTVGKTNKTFVIVKGIPGAPSGKINMKVDCIVKRLRESNF